MAGLRNYPKVGRTVNLYSGTKVRPGKIIAMAANGIATVKGYDGSTKLIDPTQTSSSLNRDNLLMSDDFTGVATTLLQTTVAETGQAWAVAVGGAFQLNGDGSCSPTTAVNPCNTTCDSGASDVDATAILEPGAASNGYVGFAVRYTDGNNCMLLQIQEVNNTAQLYSVVAGTFKNLWTSAALGVGQHTCRMRLIGGTAQIWIDGVLLHTDIDATIANVPLGTLVAVRFALTTLGKMHNFKVVTP